MQSNFGEEHKKLTGNDISLTLGYPDVKYLFTLNFLFIRISS